MSAERTSPFDARTMIWVVLAGILAFAGLLVASAYAPDIKPGGDGGGNALSTSAIGFKGVGDLLEAAGSAAERIRDEQALDTSALLVLTPEPFGDPKQLARRIALRGDNPTLIVLPKWATTPMQTHPGWVMRAGALPPEMAASVLAPVTRVTGRESGGGALRAARGFAIGAPVSSPARTQTIAGPDLVPLLVASDGGAVLVRVGDRPLFVLADPDLLDNRGTHDARTAASALAMLDWMNSTDAEGVAFDVTLNGFGRGASPLKLLFEPPFLAMTLSLAAALLLAALGTMARFGSARPRERALAFGKAALVDNTAMLIRKAGREARLGGRYVEVVREAAVRAFAVPARLRGDAVDAYLDRLGRGERFTALAGAVARAGSKAELVSAARALHDWMKGRGT